jgi:hypothetical protein
MVKLSELLSKWIWILFFIVLMVITIIANIKFFENIVQHFSMMIVAALCTVLVYLLLLIILSRKQIIRFIEKLRVPELISKHVYTLLSIVILISFAVRVAWLYVFEITGFDSDFLGYHERAVNVAMGLFPRDEYAAMFPHVYGFSYLLGMVYKVFGSAVVVSQVLNLVLFAAAIGLILCLFPPKRQPVSSFISVAILGFWPSNIYFNLIANTETAFITLWLLITVILKLFLQSKKLPQALGFTAVLMLLLAICNFIRPISMILLIAFFMIVWISVQHLQVVKKIAITLVAIAVYYSGVSIIHHDISSKIQLEAAGLPIGFNLYVGTNPIKRGEDIGLWNVEDGAEMQGLFNEYQDAQKAHDLILGKGLTRINDTINSHRLLNFLYLKIKTAWGTESWALKLVDLHLENHARNHASSTLFSQLLNGLTALGDLLYVGFLTITTLLVCIQFKRWRIHSLSLTSFFCALFLIGIFLMLLVVESAPRYHVPGIMALLIIAAEISGMNRQKHPSN